jgi:methionyl aminopeptidase
MIHIKSSSEAEAMRQGGQILAQVLAELKEATMPGTKRSELDNLARRLCLKYHVKPSFLGYGGYPSAVCVSLNNEVVHGIPTDDIISEGDLVSLDMGVEYAGFHTDSALSFVCGEVQDDHANRLIKATEHSFYSGVDLIKNGVHLGDVSAKIQETAESYGYGIVRALVGHGIGENIHEDPHVPNYGTPGTGPILKTGTVIAIEPMLTESGEIHVDLEDDGWTYVTHDGSRAAHFEHTVLVTDEGYEILTQK